MKDFILIILMASIFFCSCSSKNGKNGDVFCNKIADMVTNRSDNNIQNTLFPANLNFSYSEEDKNFFNTLRSKDFTEDESHVMVCITHEKYDHPVGAIAIKFNGGHFWYIHNGQTYLNCGIFAVIRLLYHLGLQGIVDKDLWYKNNIIQLRAITAAISGKEFESQCTMLPESAVTGLLNHLGCPAQFIKIERVGSTYENEAKKQITILRKEIQFFEDISRVSRTEMISRIDRGYYNNPLAGRYDLSKKDRRNYCILYPGNKNALANSINFNRKEIDRYQKMIDTGDYSGLNL